jgi:hypothetical protein
MKCMPSFSHIAPLNHHRWPCLLCARMMAKVIRLTRTKDGRRGFYLKCNSWPSATISRTERWGWHMENDWVMYTTDSDDQAFLHAELDSEWDDDDDDDDDDDEDVDGAWFDEED